MQLVRLHVIDCFVKHRVFFYRTSLTHVRVCEGSDYARRKKTLKKTSCKTVKRPSMFKKTNQSPPSLDPCLCEARQMQPLLDASTFRTDPTNRMCRRLEKLQRLVNSYSPAVIRRHRTAFVDPTNERTRVQPTVHRLTDWTETPIDLHKT